jgi:hypothetical protein
VPEETRKQEAAQGEHEQPEPTHSETRPRQAGEALGVRASRASVRPSAFGVPRSPYSSAPPPPVVPHAEAPRGERAQAAHAWRRAEAAQREPAPLPQLVGLDLDADDEETETRPALPRIQNERSRVVDQLTAEAPAPAARAQSASSPPRVATPTRPAASPAPAHSAAPSEFGSGAESRASTSGSSADPRASTFGSRADPRASTFGSRADPRASTPPARARRPWGSIALFAGMSALSVVPLLRYAGSHEAREAPPPAQATFAPRDLTPIVTSVASSARAQEIAERTEAQARAAREQQLASLVAAANRALDASAIPEAERLFARIIELDEDNPRAAFGLARVRLAQGNLSGAEGWIQLALRKRPKRRAYHALYAELLSRLGRADEAQEEQRHAELKEQDEER